jgi:uncharacterized protein (TIGR04255 family)
MTAKRLPTKLNKEPLVDAVFEIRFSSSTPASSVLPGFFFAKLEATEWLVDRLPVSELPSQMRSLDPILRYQPMMRIHWGDFLILMGDTMLGVASKIPYSGWPKFRDRIVKAVERYSLKYDDIIEAGNLAERIQMINMDIRIGSHTVKEEQFTVRLEIPHNNFINIVQIASAATAKLIDGHVRNGILVDTDTILNHQTSDLRKFLDELPSRLDAIHTENKMMFFECLKPETIASLEPVYE